MKLNAVMLIMYEAMTVFLPFASGIEFSTNLMYSLHGQTDECLTIPNENNGIIHSEKVYMKLLLNLYQE